MVTTLTRTRLRLPLGVESLCVVFVVSFGAVTPTAVGVVAAHDTENRGHDRWFDSESPVSLAVCPIATRKTEDTTGGKPADGRDSLVERGGVEQIRVEVGVRPRTVEVTGPPDDVGGERLRVGPTEGPPVRDGLGGGTFLCLGDGLDPLGLAPLVVLAQHLLRDLLAVVGKPVLVERADDVGDPEVAVLKETLDLAVLVYQSGLFGALGDDSVHVTGERL